jgi:hypothetical protein
VTRRGPARTRCSGEVDEDEDERCTGEVDEGTRAVDLDDGEVKDVEAAASMRRAPMREVCRSVVMETMQSNGGGGGVALGRMETIWKEGEEGEAVI